MTLRRCILPTHSHAAWELQGSPGANGIRTTDREERRARRRAFVTNDRRLPDIPGFPVLQLTSYVT